MDLYNFTFKIFELKTSNLNNGLLSAKGDESQSIMLNGPCLLEECNNVPKEISRIKVIEKSIDQFNEELKVKYKSNEKQNIEISSCGNLYHVSLHNDQEISFGFVELYIQTNFLLFLKLENKNTLISSFPLVYNLFIHKPQIHLKILNKGHINMLRKIPTPLKNHVLHGNFKVIFKNEN